MRANQTKPRPFLAIGGFIALLMLVCVIVLLGCRSQEDRKDAQEAQRSREQAEDLGNQRSAVEKIGDVDLEPAALTFGEMKTRLGVPDRQEPGAQNETVVRWACLANANGNCAITAGFLASGSVSDSARPASIRLDDGMLRMPSEQVSLFAPFRGSIRGIHLGDPVGNVISIGRARGYTSSAGAWSENTHWDGVINWDNEWSAQWQSRAGLVTRLEVYSRRFIRLPI